MHVQLVGHLRVDLGQELLELDGAVAPVQRGDDLPVGSVERREQAGHPVADIVVGAFLGHAGHHRERRLGAGQRLYLRLLIHAQHDRALGGFKYSPTNGWSQARGRGDQVEDRGVPA